MVQSKYTKDEPFEFESYYGTVIKVWPHVHNGISDVMVKFGLNPAYSISRESARAVLAFDATENPDTWAWTNDDHTEARKGRWHTKSSRDGSWWGVYHDDFGKSLATASAVRLDQCCAYQYSAREALDDFLAWSAEQRAQEQPSGFGYVGTITDDGGQVYDVFHTDDEKDPFTWTERNSGVTGISSWGNIPWRNTFKGVEDA